MNALTVITPAHRAHAFIRKGQRAWSAIKATAEEQRTLWPEIGVALMYGKQKENRAEGQKFSEWVQEMFPGLRQNDASAAIWFAENSTVAVEIPAGLTHPENIRQWCRDQATAQALPEDLKAIAPQQVPKLEARDASRVVKTLHRAESKDEGADIAAKHLEALARKHGIDISALTEAAKNAVPDEFFRFGPQQALALDQFRGRVRSAAQQMESDGLSREAIKAVLINLANSL